MGEITRQFPISINLRDAGKVLKGVEFPTPMTSQPDKNFQPQRPQCGNNFVAPVGVMVGNDFHHVFAGGSKKKGFYYWNDGKKVSIKGKTECSAAMREVQIKVRDGKIHYALGKPTVKPAKKPVVYSTGSYLYDGTK